MLELLYAYVLLISVLLLAFRNMYTFIQLALMALYFVAAELMP